jgi:hypothetical protein
MGDVPSLQFIRIDQGHVRDAINRATAERRHDRARVYEGLGVGVAEALADEDRHGREVIFAPGVADGVAPFDGRAR